MKPNVRKTVLLFNLAGAFVCLVLYGASFSGLTIDRLAIWFPVLFAWLLLNFLLVFTLALKSFADHGPRNWPRWAKWVSRVLALILGVHFLVILIQEKGGIAAIRDGVFVVSARGHVIREITESEFARFKAAELRFMSYAFLNAFCMLALELWIPKTEIDSEQALTDRSSPTRD